MKKNNVLKDYIIQKYGSISKFACKENFSKQSLELLFQKKDFFYELGAVIKICGVLGIDPVKLFCGGEIASIENKKTEEEFFSAMPLDEIIRYKYAMLSEGDRQKTLEYADYILAIGDGS